MPITPGTPLADTDLPKDTADAQTNAAAVRTAIGAIASTDIATGTITPKTGDLDFNDLTSYLPQRWSIDISGVSYTAVADGEAGGDITVAHVISGTGSAVISVGVVGNAITVTAGSATTNSTVAAAVNGNGAAAALVTAAALGSGTQTFSTKTATNLTSPLSKVGGAGKVLQINDNGQVVTGTMYAQNSGSMTGAGNILIPDLQGIRWYKRDGTLSNAGLYMWELHDGFGGELILQSPWRVAIIPSGPMQMFANDALRAPRAMTLVSGRAANNNAAVNYMPSASLEFQTNTWDGAQTQENKITFQAIPLDTSGDLSVLKLFDNATTGGYDGGGGSYDTSTGTVTGNLIAEFYRDGIWSEGTAPDFDSLTDQATITLTCSKYKTVQTSKVTLTDDRTLDITGELAGMRGVIYVKQGAGAPHTLTLPANSAKSSTFALSTTLGQIDRLCWEYDGTYYYWTIDNGIEIPLDTDASAFIDAGRANISDATQRSAINDLVIALKGSNVDGTGTLWSKFSVLYPFVGGVSASHAKNLKSTSYDITWVNDAAGRHTSNGVTGDVASNFYGNTGFAMNVLGQNNCSVYAYCKTQTPSPGSTYLLGATNGTTSRMFMQDAGGGVTNSLNTASDSGSTSVTDWRKHLALSRGAAGSYDVYVNSTKTTASVASAAPWSENVFLFARNNLGSPNGYSPVNFAFVAFGQDLSDAEWTAFRAIIDAYQTALGRANP